LRLRFRWSEAGFAELPRRSFKIIAQREGSFGTRLLGATEDLFPERASEVMPQGLPALCTKEFLRQILAGEGTDRIWPQTSTSAQTI
jgi:hypothetical protein